MHTREGRANYFATRMHQMKRSSDLNYLANTIKENMIELERAEIMKNDGFKFQGVVAERY